MPQRSSRPRRRLLIPLAALLVGACSDSPAQPADETPPTGPAPDEPIASWIAEPRVVVPDVTDSVRIEIELTDPVPDFRVAFADGSERGTTVIEPGRREVWIPADRVLDRYTSGELKSAVGSFEVLDEGEWRGVGHLGLNVAEDTPERTGTPVADGAQLSTRVLNLRVDGALGDDGVVPQALRRTFEILSDDYDWVALVNSRQEQRNRSMQVVRNEVEGIGLTPFEADSLELFGSPERLLGFVTFPLDAFFEPAGRGLVHELGHSWIMFLDNPELEVADFHWPPSNMAHGVMGFDQGGQGLVQPGPLIPAGPNRAVLHCSGASQAFSRMDLYLMGLVPTDSVPEQLAFENGRAPECGVPTAAFTFTVQDVVDFHGPRVPAWPDAPTEFRLAVVVLSEGRLLDPAELGYFEALVERAESTGPVLGREGLVGGLVTPFGMATIGRATLSTVLLR